VKDNLDNCDAKYSNYINGTINNAEEWSVCISSPEWIMIEWFMRQTKKAEEMCRRAIVDKNGTIV
jgi:hypothetical protein